MSRRKGKQGDPVQWRLREQAVRYKDSQQSGRPRRGVTWFAVDFIGQLAIFNSRESGNVPLAVFTNTLDEHLKLYEHFTRPSEEQLTGDDEIDSPKQGLYFYEIEYDTMDGYSQLGVPDAPLNLAQCPDGIRGLIAKVQFDGTFRDQRKIVVAKHWKCV